MKTVGITAEYNPFHNGHAYHTEKARDLSGADRVIAVMSGDFTQRGEPAVCDKWERAKTAVTASPQGPDLVVELPFAFACSRASIFARGAVDMLVGLGADCISFGCEAEGPAQLRTLAEVLTREEKAIDEARAVHMKEGISGAKAFELAVSEAAGNEAALLLREPNNILAVEYLKRILYWRAKGCDVADLPVRRCGSGYREASGDGTFAGAGALRKLIEAGEDVSRFVPEDPGFEDLKSISEQYLQLLKGTVLRSSPQQLARICGVGEGMENSIIRQSRKAASLQELVSALTSVRYTSATVKRALTHILTDAGWDEIDRLTSTAPGAGRLLAAGEAGREHMRGLDRERFRIVTNINKEEAELDPLDAERLRLDEKASDLYHLLCGKNLYEASDRLRRPYIK